MRKTLFTLILTSSLTAVGVASAAEIEGRIVRTDGVNRLVLLDTGDTLQAAPGVDLTRLDWGEAYEITYDMENGRMVAKHFVEKDDGGDTD